MRTTTEALARGLAALLLMAATLPARADVAGTPAGEAEARALLARPLTAASAVRIALLRQPEVRAARREVEAAQGRRVQAGLLPNPEVKLDLRQPRGAADPLQSDVEVELDLGRLLLTPARIGVADATVEAAHREAERTLAAFAHEVRVAVYEVQAAERRWQSAARLLDTAVAARDAARALHDAGNVTGLLLARHEAASEVARIEADELELALHGARERLQRLLGLHGAETTWQVGPLAQEALPALPELADVERRAVEASRELARMRAEWEALTRSARLARVESWLPELSVDLHAERDEARWELGGGVRVSVPLFDRRQGDRAALLAELRALESRQRAAAVNVRSHAREAQSRALATAARAEFFRERVLPAKRRVVRETLLQYNAMQENVFALLDAKREELAAERAADDATLEALSARSALDALLAGAPFEPAAPAARGAAYVSTPASTGGH